MVLATAFLPIALLLTIAYVRNVNPRLEEAGRLVTGWLGVIRKITLPIMAPGIAMALVLIFLLTMGDFGAPSFLRLSVFPVASLTQSSAFYNYGAASTAAMPLLAIVIGGLIIIRRVTGQKVYSFRWGSGAGTEQIPLGHLKPLVFLIISFLAILAVGFPLAGLFWRGCSIAALAEAFERAGDSALRSFAYGTLAAAIVSALGFFLGYAVHNPALRRWSWSVDALGLSLFTLPGAVIAIGLIAVWNRPSTNWMYATPAILIIAFVAQYAALGIRITSAGLSQVSPSLEEAAELAGAGWFRRVFIILAPVLRSALFTSWAIVFVFCLRDVPLPLLLAPPGQDTLTARTMTLMANGTQELVAALGILAVLLPIIPLAAFVVLHRAWRVLA
jgi:iron(III) transport system permease protein